MPTFLLKTFKIIGIALAILVVLLIGLAASLPSLISKPSGKEMTLRFINKAIDGCVEVENLSLSWFGGQKITNFRLSSSQGEEIFRFDSFSTEQTLFSLLLRQCHFGKTELRNPKLHYVTTENGDVNFEKALCIKKTKKKKRKKKCREITGEIEVTGGEIVVESPVIKPIIITELNLVLKNEELFHISAKTEQGGVNGEILLSGNLGEKLHLVSDIKNFPVSLLDELRGTSLFTAAFGNKFDIIGEFEKQDGALCLQLDLSSSNLKGKVVGKTSENTFTLDPTSSIVFSLQPQLFDELVSSQDWTLANKPQITLKFEEFVYLFEQDLFCVVGSMNLGRAEIYHETLGNFSLNDFEMKIDTRNDVEVCYSGKIQSKGGSTTIVGQIDFDKERNFTFTGDVKGFPTELLEIVFEDAKRLPMFVGHQFDVKINGKGVGETISANYELSSLKTNLKGSLERNELSKWTATSQGTVTLPEKLVPYLGQTADLTMTAPWPKVFATLKNDHLSLEASGKLGDEDLEFAYEDVNLMIEGKIIKPKLFEGREAFQSGSFYIHVDGAKNLIMAKADLGDIAEKGRPEVHASVQIENFIVDNQVSFKDARVLGSGIASDFPTDLLNLFTSKETPYAALFGPRLKMEFELWYTPKQVEHLAALHLDASGSGFETSLSLILSDTLHVEQSRPSFIRWDLTPERYQTLLEMLEWQGKSPYVLNQRAKFELVINDFVCPTPPHESVSSFLCQSGFTGDLLVQGLDFRNPESKDFLTIPRISGSIQGQDFSKSIHITLTGAIEAPTIPADQKSAFYFDGQMNDFWTLEGKFNRERLKLKGDLRFDLVPVAQVLTLLPLKDSARRGTNALLGGLINGRVYGEISELSGPMTVDIKSSNFKALLPLQLDKGTLFLKQTVETELTLTPEVSEVFLKEINPLVIQGAWSDRPVKLYIDAHNFVLPLHPFSLKGVNVETAVIDLGKIRVRNGGDLAEMMKFLKVQTSQEGVMEAWFTPIFVSLSNGVARYRRFDLLLGGSVHLAFWGAIDLANDRVEMTIGVSEQTLSNSFKISGIGSDMFQLKMGGTTSHVEVDWNSASKRIGVLIAKSAAGGLGNLVGGLLEGIMGVVGEGPTPPPTTYPFPWQK